MSQPTPGIEGCAKAIGSPDELVNSSGSNPAKG